MYSMAAEYLLVSYYKPTFNNATEIRDILREINEESELQHVCYINEDNSLLVEIIGLDKPTNPLDVVTKHDSTPAYKKLMALLDRDIEREILELKETVKAQETFLPQNEYIQLRYIEVPLNKLNDYHDWREGTIFSYARDIEQLNSFESYHSHVSREPGVKFLLAFDCKPAVIQELFTNDQYKTIIEDAGKYIVGGSGSLFTRFFKKMS